MLFQHNALMQKIEGIMEAARQIFSGDVEDEKEALYQLEGLLADVFYTRRELLFMRPEDRLDEMAPRLAAQVGHLFLKHAELSRDVGDEEAAERSFDLAVLTLKNGIGEDLELTGESSEDLMRQLLRHERAAEIMGPEERAEAWRDIFEAEVERQRYALAENALFDAIQLASSPDNHVRRGIRFFETLLKLPDEAIEDGGLTRAEAKAALEELRSR